MTEAASPVAWPHGKTAAAAFTFDVDAESAVLWGSPANADRMSVISHQAYGPLVGVPRLLRLLDSHQLKSTFFVPGYTAHRYPGVVRDIAAAGHEMAHHGYLHEQPTALDMAEEVESIDRGLAALEEETGARISDPSTRRTTPTTRPMTRPGLVRHRTTGPDSLLRIAQTFDNKNAPHDHGARRLPA